jgi:hypothetical protein
VLIQLQALEQHFLQVHLHGQLERHLYQLEVLVVGTQSLMGLLVLLFTHKSQAQI